MTHPPNTTEAIGSIRVSTDKQDAAAQESRIRQWCTLNGRTLVAVYGKAREGESGTLPVEERETEAAITDACKRRCVLVVDSLDRISRIVPDLYAVAQRVLKSGANIICIDVGLDLRAAWETAFGRFIFGQRALYAQLERDTISERTIKALKDNRKNGCAAGHAPYGMMIDKDRPEINRKTKQMYYPHLIENAEEQEGIKTIHGLHDSGLTVDEIITELHNRGIRPRNGAEYWQPTQIRRLIARGENRR